ncbi:MAG: cation transport protein ChaC [Rhodospirillaceae bacterium]|nr:MAG: cation transport protein ChaC [Rhodospirillaceae bacterium]
MCLDGDRLWVFGYGSLMWQPGFSFIERRRALLRGYHRAPCVLSTHYRGTAEIPGLVVGLDRGGACCGIAFAAAATVAAAVIDYLQEREIGLARGGGAYIPRYLTVFLDDGRRVSALSYVANRTHPQYIGCLSLEQIATLIRQGVGHGGTSRDYFASLLHHLSAFDIQDHLLQRLVGMVDTPAA